MNKYTLYLPLFFALFALAGCEKEHTGYLFTENARYPIDSLKIIRYEDYNQEVIRLEEQLNSYSGEILDSLNAYRTIEAEEEKIIEELDRLEGIMNKHGEKLNAYLDHCLHQIRDRIERKIKALCQEAGLETPFTIARELEKLQKQQALDIPWTTSCIEQLLGTEPITYTLVSIRSDRGEAAAADFGRYLSVIGGGRMYVDAKVNSPAGKYMVSLRVSNEGYSVVLPDIFTFILQ